MDWLFFCNSALLGVGLAMDAFSVSLANGLQNPKMRLRGMCGIAGVFAFFQALMPMTGWICIHSIAQYFTAFEKLIPWIALVLLCYIGGKIIFEGVYNRKNPEEIKKTLLSFGLLMVQGVATSIDALSVGFTIADYPVSLAAVCALIIASVTFCICFAGLAIGKRFGTHLAWKANLLGGLILIGIGIEIFVKGVFFG